MSHIHGIRSCLSFCVWLISLSIMFLRFIHIVAYIRTCFLAEDWVLFHCIYFILFIRLPAVRLLDCFHVAFGEQCSVNTGIQVCITASAFSSLGSVPGSGIARSYGNSWFNSQRNISYGFDIPTPSVLTFWGCLFSERLLLRAFPRYTHPWSSLKLNSKCFFLFPIFSQSAILFSKY